MATQNNRMALVCAGVALCNVLVAAAAQAQDVSFEGAQYFGAGNFPYSVAVGDFNGDELQDLAVARNAGTVSVLINLLCGAGCRLLATET